VLQTQKRLLLRRLRYDWGTVWRSLSQILAARFYGMQAAFGSRLADMWQPGEFEPAIDTKALELLRAELRTGDLVFVRAENKLTSALLPGFWSHIALYVGGDDVLERLADRNLEQVRQHRAQAGGRAMPFGMTLEAINHGVTLRPLERCLIGDHVLVLRPNVSEADRSGAVAEGLRHLGKPYDFEFDFNSATRLVCTELVYRGYQRRGRIDFPLVKRLGRFTLTSDDIVGMLLTASERSTVLEQPFRPAWLGLRLAHGELHVVPERERIPWLRAIQGGLRPTTVNALPGHDVSSTEQPKEAFG
jgi:uncharacterized protein YycO